LKKNENRELLQKDIETLQEWSDTWLLKFHPKKCKVMTIGRQDDEHDYYFGIDQNKLVLERTDKEKDIGVVIDNKLDFDEHISTVVNKANNILGVIRRSYIYLDTVSFMSLYKALVRSHFEYAVPVWAPYKQKHINAIESIQRRATKMIPGFKELEYEDRLRKLKLPTLVYRRLRGDMIETFKVLKGVYDKEVTHGMLKLRKDVVRREGGRNHDLSLFQNFSKRNVRKYFFSNRICNTWNNLPVHVIQAEKVNTFKNRLDNCWSEQEVLYNYQAALSTTDYQELRNEELLIEDT
jgi:hypothetical protein